jgi:hypothetical protein
MDTINPLNLEYKMEYYQSMIDDVERHQWMQPRKEKPVAVGGHFPGFLRVVLGIHSRSVAPVRRVHV